MNINMPATTEASVITSFPPSSHENDIIDLTDINDSDECEVTSSCSVIVSNTSVNPQQPGSNAVNNRRRKNSNSSADDSICILYEKIQPPPDIEFLNEVVIRGSGDSVSTNNDSHSVPIPPIILGSYAENPVSLSPEISNGRPSISSQPIDYSSTAPIRALQQAPHHSSLPSCKFATAHEGSSITFFPPCPGFLQRYPLVISNEVVPLHSKTLPDNLPSQSSGLESSNIEVHVPKIRCGICLDGPEELAESDRNFTSTNCGHVFCNVCIATSLKKVNKCPNCRKKVTSRQIHRLYL